MKKIAAIKNIIKTALFADALFLVTSSCEIGLGSSVDTQIPVVTIEAPSSSQVVMDDFTLYGKWSDDKFIKNVLLTLKNEAEELLFESREAELTEDSWSYDIATNASVSPEDKFMLPDGKYELHVVAYDTAGHASGEKSVTFDVDTMPPVFLVSKPDSVDAGSPSVYGRKVQIKGALSDEHSVTGLTVKIYDADNADEYIPLPNETFTEFDVNETAVTIAQYYSEYEDEATRSLLTPAQIMRHENYLALYGDRSCPLWDSTRNYNAVIEVEDNAGNKTGEAYLEERLNALIAEATGSEIKSVTPDDIRYIKNGTFMGSVSDESLEKIKKILNGTYEQTSEVYKTDSEGSIKLAFSVNSNANPTYKILNYSYTEGNGSSFTATSIDSALSLYVSKGIDNAGIYPDTISVNIYHLDNDNTSENYTKKVSEEVYATIDGSRITDRDGNAIGDDSATVTEATYIFELDKSLDLKAGNIYSLEVTGEDENQNELLPFNNGTFGFAINDSTSTTLTSLYYEIEGGITGKTGSRVYINNTAKVTVYGNYENNVSGVQELSFALGDNENYIPETVAYGTETITSMEQLSQMQFASYSEVDKTYIKSWKAEFTPAQGGVFFVTGKNSVQLDTSTVITLRPKVFSLVLDNESPSISVDSLSDSFVKNTTYYVNNTGKTFTLKGTASDNTGLDKIKLTVTNPSGGQSTVYENKGSSAYNWKFENINLSTLTGGAVFKLVLTDNAGNSSQQEITVEFDTTAPQAWHYAPDGEKDIVFRMGKADNSEADINAAGVSWNASKDAEAGIKYGGLVYGNDMSITIRGNFTDSGCGVKTIYYKLFDGEPTSLEISSFVNNYAALASGSFAPSEVASKRVFYEEGGVTKYKEVPASFMETISGFTNNTNYLVLVAVDNVGNAAADYLNEYYIEEGDDITSSGNWNEGKHYYSFNIDTQPPQITSDITSTVYTNKVTITKSNGEEGTISGIVTDDISGIKEVVVSVNSKTISSLTGANAYGRIELTQDGDYSANNTKWEVFLNPAAVFAGTADGNITVYVSATDNSGDGNKTTSGVATICLDSLAPAVSIAGRGDTTVNGNISVSGTISEKNNLNGKLVLYYTTNSSYGTAASVSSVTPVSNPASGWVKYSEKDNAYNDIDSDTNWEITSVKTGILSAEDGTAVYLTASASDIAGNTGYANPVSLTVDQNTDRPVIRITNIDSLAPLVSQNESERFVWLKNTNTVYFETSDDDGVIKNFEYSDNGGTWKSVTLSNGSGNFSLSDGDHSIKFRIKDAENKTFASDNVAVNAPYITGGTENDEYTIPLSLKIDKTVPVSKNYKYSYYSTDSSEYTPYPANANNAPVVGGHRTKVRIQVEAGDENKIRTISARLADVEYPGTVGDAVFDSSSNKFFSTCEVSDLPVDALETRTHTIAVIITDMAGLTREESLQLSVDNSVPDLEILSPAETETSKGGVMAYGSVSDRNSVESMYFAVSPSNTIAPGAAVTQWTGVENNVPVSGTCSATPVYKPISNFGFNWNVYFDDDIDNTSETHDQLLSEYLSDYGIEIDENFNSCINLYLWIKAVDEVGNTAQVPFKIYFDPKGDTPDIDFSYPEENGSRLGGTVTIYGTATDNEGTHPGVHSVWVQIISCTHGEDTTTVYGTLGYDEDDLGAGISSFNLNKKDFDYLASSGYSIYNMKKYGTNGYSNPKWGAGITDKENGFAYSDYAILASYTGSAWSLDINASQEFDLPADSSEDTNPVGIRICARDNDGKFSKTQDILVQFDAAKPVFEPFSLVQYDNGNAVASRAYTKEMFVRGTWYLEGSVTDGDKIGELKIRGDTLVSGSECVVNNGAWEVSLVNDKKTAVFKYKINGTDEGAGRLEFKVSAKDAVTVGTVNEQVQTLVINYDNQAPVIAQTKQEGLDISADVQQSNSWYTFSSKASEDAYAGVSQSGFAYTAVYFKRHYVQAAVDTTILYDVLEPRASAANDVSGLSVPNLGEEAADAPDNTIVYDGQLYWFVKSISSVEKQSFEVTDLTHIRKNGLIKVGGSDYLIDAVNTDSSKVAISGTLSDTSYTRAYVALAAIVDNTVPEGDGIGDDRIQADGYFRAPARDDGDRMIESVKKEDTTWTWKASVCSKNIPDGPIEVCYVVFDKAGNSSTGSVTGNVSNNCPRIAGFVLTTDYNADQHAEYEVTSYNAESLSAASETDTGIYDPEAKTLYSNGKSKNPLSTSMTKGDTDRPLLTVRGLTTLTPEIVGGNGAIYYSYNIAGSSSTLSGNNTTTPVTDNGSINYSINTVNNPVTIALGDLIILGDSSDGVPFKFTFWDSTAGGVRFTSTQKAELTVYLAIDTQTLGTPSTTMVPFYWKSLKENSIYKSSTATSYSDLKGHIELGSDWMTTETYAQNAALPAGSRDSLYDADPKVSGKIVIEGSSHDDKLITELKANVFGTAYTAASYNAGNGLLEASHNDFGTRGYYLKITSQTSDSSGHDVSWELYIDTEAAGTVGRDRTVTMQAFNSGVPANVRTTGGAYTGVSGTSGYDYTNGEGNHSAVGNTPETAGYKMDIVPYITEITTALSKAEENNPSVYSRTALGHYPVYVNFESPLVDNGSVTYSYEKIKVRGFNLENGSLIFEDGDSAGDANKVNFSYATEQDLSNWASVYLVDVPSGAKSGAVNVTVSGIKSLNNINNNDARGSSPKVTDKAEGDYDVYCDYYNRQPNGTNNNRLTDDVNIDVWLFNTAAARPMNNSTLDIMMDINPSSGIIGFAFCNGHRNFSMGNLAYSYTNWIRSVDFIQCTGFAYDQDGQSYGLCAGGESDAPKKVDGCVFLTGRWGVPGESSTTAGSSTGGNATAAGINGSLRIETTGQLYDGSNADLNKTRFLSPSYASVDGAAGYENVYLAFYDDLNGEIRFRAGALKKSATKKTELDTSGVFGHFRDRFTSVNSAGLNAQNYAYSANDCQIVANGDGDALGYAGEYVSIGVTSDNVVVMVWYDVENGNLMYTYNEDPLDLHTGTTGDGWEPAVPLLAGAGKYCHIAVDGADGIHVAAYDSSNGDLKYVYLPSYDCDDTEWKNCTVDSYQTVGKELTIDVAAEEFDGTTYYIPHIGYWGNTPKKPRYAYIADPAAFNEAADADARSGTADDCYTGIWECSVVPTKSDMTKDSRRRINVGVWTETKTVNGEDVHGHLKDSVEGASYAATDEGKCYGNGTDNAVLGYGVKHSSTQDFVETAQKM